MSFDLTGFRYHEDKIKWIHEKEKLTKKEFKAQIGNWYGATQFPLPFRGSLPILYSLGDAIQILSRLQTDEERAKLNQKLEVNEKYKLCENLKLMVDLKAKMDHIK